MKEKHGIEHSNFAQICQKYSNNVFTGVGKNYQTCSDVPGLASCCSLFIFLHLFSESIKDHASFFHCVHLSLNTWNSGTETRG